jgi:hypothetical protein
MRFGLRGGSKEGDIFAAKGKPVRSGAATMMLGGMARAFGANQFLVGWLAEQKMSRVAMRLSSTFAVFNRRLS